MTRLLPALARALLLVALAAGAARAQAPAGGAMPDARQGQGMTSGVARPDAKIAPGTLTVRVVRGDVGAPAPPETVVHLVGLAAGGEVTLASQPIGADGRAEFEKLPTDGSAAYHAFAQVGDDRLGSTEPVTMPPGAGVRMMLVGRKVDAEGKPVGEPIDDQIDPDDPGAPAAAPGEAVIGVRSTQPGPFDVEVLSLDRRQPVTRGKTGPADPSGVWTARVAGLADGPAHVYVARLTLGGRPYLSRPFMLAPGRGAVAAILAYERMLFSAHGGGQLDDDRMWFQVRLTLGNMAGTPVDPGPEGLRIPLPRGFRGAQLEDEAMVARVKVIEGQGLAWRGPIAPGVQEVVVGWSLPVEDGVLALTWDLPLGLYDGQVIVDHIPGSTVTTSSPAITPRPSNMQGHDFWVMSGIMLEPGATLSIRVDGLPARPFSERLLRWGAGLVVLALALWAFLVVILGGGKEARPRADAIARRKELAVKRDRLYDELVALERGRAAGRVDEAAYARQRTALVSKLTLCHRELDDLDAGRRPEPGASTKA